MQFEELIAGFVKSGNISLRARPRDLIAIASRISGDSLLRSSQWRNFDGFVKSSPAKVGQDAQKLRLEAP